RAALFGSCGAYSRSASRIRQRERGCRRIRQREQFSTARAGEATEYGSAGGRFELRTGPEIRTGRISEAVGRGGAVAEADRDVGVTVEAVADAADGAHDVLVAAELGAQAAHVHVDGALTGGVLIGRGLPQRGDELGALDGAALTQHQVLQQL